MSPSPDDRPASAADYALGVDLGGSRIKAVAVTPAGKLLAHHVAPTSDEDHGWRGAVARIVAALEDRFGPAACLGVSSPGLAARDARTILWMQGRMAGVQGYDWQAALGRAASVPVINDAHAALLGEQWLGAARGEQDVVLLTLGTGVGGAILCDGRLLHGRLGRAGHLGHITVDSEGPLDIVNTPGSLEDAVGDHTVRRRTDGKWNNTQELVVAAAAGNVEAAAHWRRSLRALAAGIASIVNAVDPALVVLGGGIARAGALLFEPLQAELDRVEWRPTGSGVRLAAAELGELAGAVGAARFAREEQG